MPPPSNPLFRLHFYTTNSCLSRKPLFSSPIIPSPIILSYSTKSNNFSPKNISLTIYTIPLQKSPSLPPYSHLNTNKPSSILPTPFNAPKYFESLQNVSLKLPLNSLSPNSALKIFSPKISLFFPYILTKLRTHLLPTKPSTSIPSPSPYPFSKTQSRHSPPYNFHTLNFFNSKSSFVFSPQFILKPRSPINPISYRLYSSSFSSKISSYAYTSFLFAIIFVFAYIAYILYNNMISPSSPVRIYNNVLNLVRSSPKVIHFFGEHCIGHGEPSATKMQRNRSINHSYSKYKNSDLNLLTVRFYIAKKPLDSSLTSSILSSLSSLYHSITSTIIDLYNSTFDNNPSKINTSPNTPNSSQPLTTIPPPLDTIYTGVVVAKLLEKSPNSGDYDYYSISVKVFQSNSDSKIKTKVSNLNIFVSSQAANDYYNLNSKSLPLFSSFRKSPKQIPSPPSDPSSPIDSSSSSWLNLIKPSSWS
ncbi:Mitochondrial import inner membrane translocase subunit Tim21 [Smittium culicis]|uniref:Mitochondrial import inner membrane translocase subunit TIM21 n=1 Tax=Smittium culicis TaxID=133412 RepID=A0A1R1YP48_9FUNG|nr:Mitochondrial import inner membrane translocase subunit Tim21 [Smittium culicis]